MPSDLEKPTITYPCLWDYRVIMTTKDESALKELLETYQRPFKLELKNTSRNAKFYSLNVAVEVSNELARKELLETYQRPFKLELKNTSKNAKFYSFNVSVEVSNELERNEVFQKISQLDKVVQTL
ncbi:HP0495 family protein [Helicobacter pylori]|uniref:HP0495 family protein n=1 Tax=Helicobacter pylori TaxID=210 RepID=UPI001C56A038